MSVNVCTASDHDGCAFTSACSMYGVWRSGQERMLEVFRSDEARQAGDAQPAARVAGAESAAEGRVCPPLGPLKRLRHAHHAGDRAEGLLAAPTTERRSR
jgi:hypothetical protein